MNGPKFDGLYLGREQGGELVYAGKVEQGFSDADVKSVRERLTPLLQRAQALSRKVNKPKARWASRSCWPTWSIARSPETGSCGIRRSRASARI
jgi:ATP-dependent DNA ligase